MSLQDYFLHNYSTNCPPTKFLRSHDFFALSVHILSPFSAILGVYGIIVIVVATPRSMESAKWFILHLHIATFYIEIVVNFMLMPFMFLPSGAIYATGVLMQIGFPFKIGHVIGQEAFPEYGIAILMLYENRHSSITSIPYRMTRRSTKIVFYLVHYLVAMMVLVIPYLEFVDDEAEKLKILHMIPCPEIHFFDEKTKILSTNLSMVYLCGGFEVLYFCGIVGFFSLQSSYYLLKKPNLNMSEKTRNLQKRFFFTLSIQLAIPITILFFPLLIFYVTIANGIIEQFLNSLVVIVCSFHGIISSISLIFLHKPYRNFTWAMTIGKILNKRKPSPSQEISIRPSAVVVL